MSFDRLINAMDAWSANHKEDVDVFAQIGPSQLQPSAMRWARELLPADFSKLVRTADLVVAHAGMGSVLTALEMGKPLVIMPRKGALQETRNDHQIATANWLKGRSGIYVAEDEASLPEVLERALLARGNLECINPYATERLLDKLRNFISQS